MNWYYKSYTVTVHMPAVLLGCAASHLPLREVLMRAGFGAAGLLQRQGLQKLFIQSKPQALNIH